jgi:hypothetical protein
MKSHKSIILIALVAFVLAACVAVLAQQASTQTDQKKQTESCCAMDSCCCKGDSCSMKSDGEANAGAKHDCCGDSCDMANHAKHNKKEHSGESSCCNMKNKDKQKEAKKQKAA